MEAAKQRSVGIWSAALAVGLMLSLFGSPAAAQQYAGAGRRPKVSAVTQASYEEDADPAPELDYQPSGVAGDSVTYPRYEQESVPQRIPQSRLAQEIAPKRMPQTRPAPESITPAQHRSNVQRTAQTRMAPRSHSGRPARHVAQRTASAPIMQSAPMPAPEQMILPPPDESRAAVHPMDNPFDDMDMPLGRPTEGPMDIGQSDGFAGGDCTGGECGGCHQCCCFFGPWLWDNFSVFGGVQGFKGPVDLGTNGNFGFHAGINWGVPVLDECGIGFQLGTQGVVSDLSGTTTSSDTRSQSFTTLGLFHRPVCGVGAQYGIVWDYLHDDFSRATLDLNQFRTEISLIGCRGNEIGFWSAVHTNSQSHRDTSTQVAVVNRVFQATDMYALFYRRHFCNGSWARFSGGFTNDSEGLIGADAMVPLTPCLALNTNVNYRIPNEGTDAANSRQESWGLTINLVWYPACSRNCGGGGPNPYRPLFGVADNTTFFVDRQ